MSYPARAEGLVNMIMTNGSRVKWINTGKGIAPAPTLWCSSYRKGSLWVTLDCGRQFFLYLCRSWGKLSLFCISICIFHRTIFACNGIIFFVCNCTNRFLRFNGILSYMGYLMTKSSFLKNYLAPRWEDKWLYTSLKGINLRVNVIAWLGFELAYF